MFAKKSISRIFSVLFDITFILSFTQLRAVHAAGVRYATPGGTGDCSSWANACTLQTALTGAASGDEVWVAAGTYKPTTDPANRDATFQLTDDVSVYGGFSGTETARDLRNPAINVTILSGDLNGDDVGFTNNSENVYHVVSGATGAILDGFTITAGNANGNGIDWAEYGGGMYNNWSSTHLTLMNVTFSGNSASYGGGMYISSSSPTLTNVTFSGNSASYGGGMYISSSSPTLTNVTFSGNSANYGGGMYNNYGSPTLTDVTFSGNSASYGGGMYNYDSVDSPGSGPFLMNVTFISNSASYGGGMYNSSSDPTLTNVTFNDNSANYGGGMYNVLSSPEIVNTILWGNPSQLYSAIYNDASTSYPVVRDSVVQDGCPAQSTCTNIRITDPKLGPLGSYGGLTRTIPLLPGSSAIDAGDDTTCPSTDQRGVVRPQGAHCDIGAYEYDYTIIYYIYYAKPTASGTGDCSSWANACILQNALTKAISGNEIWSAAGTYKPTTGTDRTATFQLKNGVALYGGFAGTETARSQRNYATNLTVLSGEIGAAGNSDNSYHVVIGADGANLDGFTITSGNANGSSPADMGGGMYNNWSSTHLTLMNLTFNGNSGSSGGGMANHYYSSPRLTNVTFSGNSATNTGGGVKNDNGSSPTLMNVTFSSNSAGSGGGMSNSDSSPWLINVTFSGNSATNTGGGMANDPFSTPMLTNVTFSGNSATNTGGGMENNLTSNPMIYNTIFWDNTAAGGGAQIHNNDTYSPPSLNSHPILGYSVVQDGCPAGSTCTNIITNDPKLGTLGSYGGFTQTIPLLAGSSAIDTGNDATCAFTDQRGITRPQGAHCDIGAFELEHFTISGNAHLSGVTLSYANGGSQTAISGSNGDYSFFVPAGWSGTVTPSKAGYSFTPADHIYHNVLTDQTDQNYTAVIGYWLFLPLVER